MTALPLLRTSERGAFKRCPQRWYWGFRMGLVSRGPEKQPLWFGTGFHLAFAEWYIPGLTRGRDPRETWAEYCEGMEMETVRVGNVYDAEAAATYVDAKELGIAMLTRYLDKWGDDPKWNVIAPEQTFSVIIEDPDNPGEGIVNYVGTFDGVYRHTDTNKCWLMEHKTASQIDTGHLPLDDQAGSYVSVANPLLRASGEMKPKESIAGIRYNFLAKRKPHDKPRDSEGRYLNKDGSVSKVQPKDTVLREPVNRTRYEQDTQLRRIANEAIVMEPFRKGQLQLVKNPTRDCKWDCDFFELCQVHETGGDYEDFIEQNFRVEDPYMDHRHGAKNTKESLELTRELKGKS